MPAPLSEFKCIGYRTFDYSLMNGFCLHAVCSKIDIFQEHLHNLLAYPIQEALD